MVFDVHISKTKTLSIYYTGKLQFGEWLSQYC